MAAVNVSALNDQLARIFHNGKAEVGLEVGSDPGLPASEWIQVPACLRREFAVRRAGASEAEVAEGANMATVRTLPGWAVYNPGDKRILVQAGRFSTVTLDAATHKYVTGPSDFEVDRYYQVPLTVDDVARFVAANTGHSREEIFDAETQAWVHASRFWALASGMVASTKAVEYTDVADPEGDLSPYLDFARQIINLRESVLTASAARAASWRKSNHATGGEIAAGFPRRWLQKSGYWKTQGERADVKNAQVTATSAFYVATHASSVHSVLALIAPTDECHWSVIDASYGLILTWDVKTSTTVRVAPKTQVSGVAMVVDAYQVMKMLISEGIFPLAQHSVKYQALVNAYRSVEEAGIRAASYANWFLDGHPTNITPVAFNQKDGEYADLVGELGAVARLYYRKSTIGDSMALENAMQQLASESAKDQWAAMNRARGEAGAEAVVAAYNRVAGKGASVLIAGINGTDEAAFTDAIISYNAVTSGAAAAVGITNPVTLDVVALSQGVEFNAN
jgi:hypothetical protein